jgi:hypothetical protein
MSHCSGSHLVQALRGVNIDVLQTYLLSRAPASESK